MQVLGLFFRSCHLQAGLLVSWFLELRNTFLYSFMSFDWTDECCCLSEIRLQYCCIGNIPTGECDVQIVKLPIQRRHILMHIDGEATRPRISIYDIADFLFYFIF